MELHAFLHVVRAMHRSFVDFIAKLRIQMFS